MIKAVNNAVFVIRDETPALSSSGLELPEDSRIKPHTGTIVTAGGLCQDTKIKNGVGKKCMFHATVGFDLEFEGVTYLILRAEEILAII